MSIRSYLLLLPLILLLAACGNDDDITQTTEVELQFLATYDGNALDNSRAYPYPGDMEVRVTLYQFYLSDIELLPAGGGDPIHLSDIEMVRFRDQFSGTAAAEGAILPFSGVPAGDYRAVRFRFGVRPDLNAKPPSEFPADYVLNENEYWGPAGMYVFAKVEGNADTDGDGMFQDKFSYHLGRDDLYQTVVYEEPFTVSATAPNRLTFVTDVYGVLTDGADFIDFRTESRIIHGHAGDPPRLQYLWDNIQESLLLQR